VVARDPIERSLISTLGAAESWARTEDRSARTAPARRTFKDRFRRDIDAQYPDVPEAARAAMAEHARKAYYLRLALKSVQARRARATARKARPSDEDGGQVA
jgi:hypothetical protein